MPSHLPIIPHIFSLYIIHKRYKTVAEELNADGYRTVNKALFTGQTVSRILQDKRHLDDGLVDQELWDEVQHIVIANKSGGKTRRVAHLFSGLLECGCGQAMYVPTNSRKYVCGDCLNKIAKDDLEAIVLENLRQHSSIDIQQAIARWPSLDFASQREIVEATVSRIIADNKKVTVVLFASP